MIRLWPTLELLVVAAVRIVRLFLYDRAKCNFAVLKGMV